MLKRASLLHILSSSPTQRCGRVLTDRTVGIAEPAHQRGPQFGDGLEMHVCRSGRMRLHDSTQRDKRWSCTSHQVCSVLEHVSDECDDVEAGECCGIAFIVFDRPTATCSPGEGSFYDPASRQENSTRRSFRRLLRITRQRGRLAPVYPDGQCCELVPF
jgi:hypothetical protein